MTSVATRLESALNEQRGQLRDPNKVMAPRTLGAARLTKYSFSRMMLRRAFADGWQAKRVRFNMDDKGRGEAAYEIIIDGVSFHFVAFTNTFGEEEHTDRVVANNWEITGALIEGELTDQVMDFARTQVPQQESGRLDPRVLTLTRGNRSVRFFEYLVGCLARGEQPKGDDVADAGYIMRSTAFYGNGKYGMRSFQGYPDGHPMGVPYRAQMVGAWCFRELSYDVVEHCAALRGGDAAVTFDDNWKRFFGLGNATGMGLVPYALKHPRVIHAWSAIRELALADVRAMPGTPDHIAAFDGWLSRARGFFVSGTADDTAPFLNPQQLVSIVDEILTAWAQVRDNQHPFDELYQWADQQTEELTELVVSLLIELHDADDREIDAMLAVDELSSLDPATTVEQMTSLIADRFAWLDDLALDSQEADHFWWLMSDNTEEPRRAPRAQLAIQGRDVAIDVALRVARLRDALKAHDQTASMASFLIEHPAHRLAAERVVASDALYGEPRDNVCADSYLPLQLQRFQLAQYGMDNFKPKSTDWLRVTLMQGAPRLGDLADGHMDEQWVLPPQPTTTPQGSAHDC